MFFSIYLGKNNAEVTKFLGILRNMSPRIKYMFVQERKAMFRLIEKLFLAFHAIFKLDFMTQIFTVLSTCVCVFISYFFCSLISVSKKWNIETMLTFPYSCNRQKLTKTKRMKKEATSIRVWTLNMQLCKLIAVF